MSFTVSGTWRRKDNGKVARKMFRGACSRDSKKLGQAGLGRREK